MAPPPEYDKEPKAPDKSATNIPCEDSKALYNLVNEHQTNSDTKSTNSSANAEVENNKHVETLDDGQLRALLDEAITYKCPKDREGKSSLFKELLEEVEQDEQACEAAARLPGRARRGAGRGRRALPHSNSLQDLVAALAAEPAPRRRHHASHAPVSARAIHGGSLPSGVDTSFLLSEEPMRGAGAAAGAGGAEYVATVRCVNPSPLAERRVSASDAHPPHEPDQTNRRSKPAFPMTYTARATLEIGSGSVGSGRAVTTTTASNQVRTPAARRPARRPARGARRAPEGKRPDPRGPPPTARPDVAATTHWDDCDHVDKWYRGLDAYGSPLHRIGRAALTGGDKICDRSTDPCPTRRDGSDRSEVDPLRLSPEAVMNAPRLKLVPESDNRHIPVVVRESDMVVDAKHSKIDIDRDDETRVLANKNGNDIEDAIARKKYRERVGQDLVVPTVSSYNPKNVRSMTIGKPLPRTATSDKRNQSESRAPEDKSVKNKHHRKTLNRNENVDAVSNDKPALTKSGKSENQTKIYHRTTVTKQNRPLSPHNPVKCNSNYDVSTKNDIVDQDAKDTAKTHTEPQIEPKPDNGTELVEMVSLKRSSKTDSSNEFSLFIANQQRLLQAIETNNSKEEKAYKEVRFSVDIEPPENKKDRMENRETKNTENPLAEIERLPEAVSLMDCSDDREPEDPGIDVHEIRKAVDAKVSQDKSNSAEAPSDASIFLTLYKRLLASPCNIDNTVLDIKSASDAKPVLAGLDGSAAKLPKKKKEKITSRLSRKPHNENSTKKKDVIRNALKKLFFDNITQSDSTNKSNKLTGKADAIATTSEQVDSAIPFSCITTPEVVASCTTTASAQAPAPVDVKMPRNVLTSSFASHGVPLPRGGPAFSAAAAVAVAAAEEFKKSLDENGNSVPGFSSPQSGSGQQKKQRRKKSSKNETVIKSHHIDGYQGNKDLHEVLRFIESAEPERHAKRHDDKKKRSAERRKDKQPRASSLDDLRAPPPPPARPARPAAPAKPERRSWGHDARDYFREREPEPDALELTDFQTVTKKRRPRRRADHSPRERSRPRAAGAAAEPASPRARSDRSNDSTDDLDSVHSLPALPSRAPAPAPPASYADIARTRHNIPDLIESCNYYAEGDERADAAPPAAPGGALAYPALDARRRAPKPAPAAPARRAGKPPEPPEPPAPPAPDVVADRRPPVILLDAPARPQDMDGVTFGFDVNEQLLGGARRPRCDLVRDAAAAEPPAARPAPPPLRYVPPAPPRDTHHLHQIIDYVGTAWEEVVRCGGKVRYFSE